MVEATASFLFDWQDLQNRCDVLALQKFEEKEDFPGFKEWETVTLKVKQSERVLAEGNVLEKVQVLGLDLLEECVIEINDGTATSEIETSLIPLLTQTQLRLQINRDPLQHKFLLIRQENPEIQEELEKMTGFRCCLVLVRKEIPDPPVLKQKILVKHRKENCFGLAKLSQFNDLGFSQDFRLALNSKLIQEEAKLINFEPESLKSSGISEGSEKILLLTKSLNHCNSIIESQALKIESLQGEIKDLQSQICTQANELSSKSSEIFSLNQKIASLQVSLQGQEGLSTLYNSVLQSNKVLKEELSTLDHERQSLRKEFELLLTSFESLSDTFHSLKPGESAQADEKHAASEVDSLKASVANQQTEILRLENTIKSLESDAKYAKTSESFQLFQTWMQSNEDLSSSLVLSNSENSLSQNVLQGINKIPSQASQLKTLHEKLRETQQKLEEAEENLQHQEGIIKLISANSKVAATLQKIDQIPRFSEDLGRVNDELSKIWAVSCDFERKFYSKSSVFFKKISNLSEMNLTMHRLVEKFVKVIYDKDCQIYMLRHIARDAALERKVYVPVKTDPIDMCLSEYINNRKSPLQIPLLREDSGVYNFYTRTIKLKIENNKVIVRLGGGFEGIDEFLNLNTQAELDKLEERRKFFCAESVKKFIDTDFQILGLPSVIDFNTPVTPLPENSAQTGGGGIAMPSSPKNKKRPSIIFKDSSAKVLMKKKTMG